ncbi:hypothetical protein OOU_Y34scaffold01112g5 [Pyricularia oryzae Y34]|uniref:NADH dehydrogenase subunit 1 n=1 Tax=Pyricularia oryzae (strain Y34) TaxID=1143189 RepID=A0AA97NLT3_PYRO3|nr:hypothetical protein OOU_Y34scaffold01112g5 [Pyricularia oryzae Y34]
MSTLLNWDKCILVPILLSVAFMTVIERKVMGSMQRRIGPNVKLLKRNKVSVYQNKVRLNKDLYSPIKFGEILQLILFLDKNSDLYKFITKHCECGYLYF